MSSEAEEAPDAAARAPDARRAAAMSRDAATSRVLVLDGHYFDSIRLLEATRAMSETAGVAWALATQATRASLDLLAEQGFTDGLAGASANDAVLAARALAAADAETAISAALELLFDAVEDGQGDPSAASRVRPRSLDEALTAAPQANVAVVSTPGPYAALEVHKALSRGLDVLLFSDNVPLAEEIALKRRARAEGRLVMGPGAGTAMLAGVGLGFSNRVRAGPVGVIAAAGTGAQEAMTLLDRWGPGVSHVIGLGGRDLSEPVGGLMAQSALEALNGDKRTESVLFVSKPPAPAVAERLLRARPAKPLVAALIGLRERVAAAEGVTVCNTLEQGVIESLALLGLTRPDPAGRVAAAIAGAAAELGPRRTRLVGLFSGGTLAYEAMTIMSRHVGAVWSNTPLSPQWQAPGPPGSHLCLDLGEEEYTQGRPHPMIDPRARVDLLSQQASDPTVAVVLIDVVIGDGAHHDPAGVLAPAAARVAESGAAVVAYVLGTTADPQGFERQRAVLRDAGCLVTETSARAALAAAALVNRDPALLHADLAVDLTT